jgi:hypothetical protein
MATKTFDGTTDTNPEVAGNWDGDIMPVNGDTLIFAADATHVQNFSITPAAVTVNAGVNHNIATFDFIGTGIYTVSGTTTIGASANIGLSMGGFSFPAGFTRVWLTTSKWGSTGNITVNATGTSTGSRGRLTVAGNLTFANLHPTFYGVSLIVDAGVNFSYNSGVALMFAAANFNLQGTLTVLNACHMGFSASATIIFGANCDIVGTSSRNFYLSVNTGTTVQNDKIGNFSFLGTLNITKDYFGFSMLPFPNCSLRIAGSTTNYTASLQPSTTNVLKCSSIIFTNANPGVTIAVRSDTANGNFEISGAITMTPAAGTITYTHGSGTITLNDGDANIDCNSSTMEKIIINATGTKTLTSALNTSDLTVTAGTYSGGGFLTTGSGAFTLGANGKLITSNTNGLIHAAGMLTGFSSYTYENGGTIEAQGSTTWDGTVFPKSANINYILNGSGKTFLIGDNYTAKTLSGLAGALKSTVDGTQRTWILSASSVISNMTIRDMTTGVTKQINAKTGCTNLGGNNFRSIIFKDVMFKTGLGD